MISRDVLVLCPLAAALWGENAPPPPEVAPVRTSHPLNPAKKLWCPSMCGRRYATSQGQTGVNAPGNPRIAQR